MASEAQVRTSLTIRKLSTDGSVVLIDRRYSHGYSADVTGTKGPSPGSLTIPTGGKRVYFDLTTPGLCVFKNLDGTNYVTVGVLDPDTNRFYPFLELLPGEEYVVRLSRDLAEEYIGTGTGTTSPGNPLFMKANTADVVVSVDAFEK